jgi:uncharacterized protein YxeA
MKKLLSVLVALFVMTSITFAQTPAKKDATTQTTTHTKKDGTADKRYKENKHKKKDGTADKRYKENKTKTATPPPAKKAA